MSPGEYVALIEGYHEQGMSDGMPVMPVSGARLAAMIAAGGQTGGTHVGAFPGRAPVRVEDVAECALLAGCVPACMPLVLTAFEILLDPAFPARLLYESAGSFFPFVLVNGPIRAELEINCRPNVFGPGVRANATIGRALRLGLARLAGATNAGDRSTLGSAYKFTCVVGEDEENSPWPPLHTGFGFAETDSTVMVLAAWQPRQVTHQLSAKPEHLLSTYAEELSTATQFNPLDVKLAEASIAPKALLVIAADHRGFMRDAGWNRKRMQAYLHQVTGRRAGEVRAAGYRSDKRLQGAADDKWIPVYRGTEDFLVVSAGSGGGRSMIGGAVYADIRKIPAAPRVAVRAPALAIAEEADPRTLDDYVALVDGFMAQGASEGWPILLPDADSVGAKIAASGRSGGDVVGHSPWRSGPITVADVAINAHMAGCSQLHMPLVVAICELLFSPETANGLTAGASTAGYHPWIVVHGPIARALGINCGASLFGPGGRANSTIGRSVRLVLINIGGYKPNVVDRACLGSAYKYGCVIAEDESASPWGPLHPEFGFKPQNSAISLFWAAHARLTLNDEAGEVEPLLRGIAEDLTTMQNFDSPGARGPEDDKTAAGAETWGQFITNADALVVLGGRHREILRRAGWSRRQIQEFLFAHNFRSAGELRSKGYATSPYLSPEQDDAVRIPVFHGPEKFHVMTAGGQGGATMVVRALCKAHRRLNGD